MHIHKNTGVNVMALITRVSRLFQADLHAVLDRIEEPDVLLKQAVREMEEGVVKDEQRLKLMQHEQGQVNSREEELEKSLIEIETEMDICFESAKEDLAKTLIRRKLELQRVCKELSHKSKALKENISSLEAQLKEYRVQLESMRQKAELLTDTQAQGVDGFGWISSSVAIRDEDVEVAYLREKQKRVSS
jgi:phage shock protein A